MSFSYSQCCRSGSESKWIKVISWILILIRINIKVISWLRIRINIEMTSQTVWNMSLFEPFFKVLSLYLKARIRIRIRIKVKVGLGSGSASKWQSGSGSASKWKVGSGSATLATGYSTIPMVKTSPAEGYKEIFFVLFYLSKTGLTILTEYVQDWCSDITSATATSKRCCLTNSALVILFQMRGGSCGVSTNEKRVQLCTSGDMEPK